MISGHARKTAIVLGGTVPHIELIRKLKARSYYVVLADFLPNPPARAHADEHVQISTLDKDDVLRLAVERKASLVISTCIDQANATACYVSEKLNLTHPYSFETSLNVTNKAFMKELMMESGIPTSKYIVLREGEHEVPKSLALPLIIKPADSNSSKGITRIDDWADLNDAIVTSRIASRTNTIVVEEFIQGTEIGIDCFVTNNGPEIVMIKKRKKIHTLKGEQQIYGCLWPIIDYETFVPKAREIATRIAVAFGLRNTPLIIQAIIRGDECFVIEFAPRIGGGESFRINNQMTGCDVMDAAIDSWMQIPVNVSIHKPAAYYGEVFLYVKAGILEEVVVKDKDRLFQNIEYIDIFKERGTFIDSIISSNNRVGVFAVKGESTEEIQMKAEVSLECIDVINADGESMLRRDIYRALSY